MLKKEEKQSNQIRQGDIMKLDAGSVVYVINSDSREKLIVAKLINPVFTPGKFEVVHRSTLICSLMHAYMGYINIEYAYNYSILFSVVMYRFLYGKAN